MLQEAQAFSKGSHGRRVKFIRFSAEGDTSEDHLGHLASNVAFLIWADKNGVILQKDFDGSM